MVTHQAPQMKNWRNIIVDRRTRTDAGKMFSAFMALLVWCRVTEVV